MLETRHSRPQHEGDTKRPYSSGIPGRKEIRISPERE